MTTNNFYLFYHHLNQLGGLWRSMIVAQLYNSLWGCHCIGLSYQWILLMQLWHKIYWNPKWVQIGLIYWIYHVLYYTNKTTNQNFTCIPFGGLTICSNIVKLGAHQQGIQVKFWLVVLFVYCSMIHDISNISDLSVHIWAGDGLCNVLESNLLQAILLKSIYVYHLVGEL